MNPFLNILGPLLPTLKPNNRDRFWTNHSRELDRIGWSGKYIFPDSEEEEEMLDSLVEQEINEGYHNTGGYRGDGDCSENSDVDESESEHDHEDSQSPSLSRILDISEPSNRQSEQQTEDYHPNTSLEYYWDDIYSSESESTDWEYDDGDDEEDYWYDVEQALIPWAAALLFVVGVRFVMWLLF